LRGRRKATLWRVSLNAPPTTHQLGVGGLILFRHSLWFACSVAMLCASTAWAVIRVDAPVTQMYDLAQLVLIGRVGRIDATEKIVEAEIVKVSKGNFAGDKIQIQLADTNNYIGQVKLNQPVVILSGVKSAFVHMADNFLSAEPLTTSEPATLKVNRVNPIQSWFPGRTVALVRLVQDIAS